MTLKDVARDAGVSESTASRVLNGSSRTVSAANVERVLAAGERLGYTANIAAQTVVRGTSPICVIIVRDLDDPADAPRLRAAMRAAARRRLRAVIVPTGDDPAAALRFARALVPAMIVDASRLDADRPPHVA